MFQTQGEFGLMPTASSVGRLEDYFVYVITETVNASSTSAPIYISIDASFDFRLILLTGEVWSYSSGAPSAIQANPLLLVNIQTASGTLLSDNPCLWNSIVGTAQRPFYILGNLVAKANSQIQITFTNQHASTAYWIMLHMHGVKQWRR
jgi:hypothetical protein